MINKLEKQLYKVHYYHKNIVAASFFSCWCLLVLDKDLNIKSKYWNEKDKVLKCFDNFKKHERLELNIIRNKKFSNSTKKRFSFKIDFEVRNWFGDDLLKRA